MQLQRTSSYFKKKKKAKENERENEKSAAKFHENPTGCDDIERGWDGKRMTHTHVRLVCTVAFAYPVIGYMLTQAEALELSTGSRKSALLAVVHLNCGKKKDETMACDKRGARKST